MALLPVGSLTVRADETGIFIVSYVEVAPAATEQAAALLRALSQASGNDSGSRRFEVLQRLDRPHHFAILEAWTDQKAQEAHAATEHVQRFRAALAPLSTAPYDERPHGGLVVGQGVGAGGIYAVTHVDFIPPRKDDGIAALKALVEPSRAEAGNVRFDVLQQSSRPNHLTLVEVWKDKAALEAHAVTPHMKAFREKLLPMSGSLFDERIYAVVK
jgi:quinol monooxygenase YgiN